MKVGIPERQGRVSPVFDSARRLWIFRVESDRPVHRMTTLLYSRDPVEKAAQVARFGVKLLICGAISRPLCLALSSAGVKVRPCICGSVQAVIEAYCNDRLNNACFQLPGTRRRASPHTEAGEKAGNASGKNRGTPATAGARSPPQK